MCGNRFHMMVHRQARHRDFEGGDATRKTTKRNQMPSLAKMRRSRCDLVSENEIIALRQRQDCQWKTSTARARHRHSESDNAMRHRKRWSKSFVSARFHSNLFFQESRQHAQKSVLSFYWFTLTVCIFISSMLNLQFTFISSRIRDSHT